MIRSGFVLALLLGASLANAAGLGKLTVNSSLGQILNAEIDLVSVQPGELDALTARVAPPEAFRDARIEYTTSLRLLRFSVEKRQNGQPYLKVTSVAPINEPFVDALVEVTWPAGRLQREYPILLDPPGYAQRAAPPTVAAAPASRATETPPATSPAASSSSPVSPSVAPSPSSPTSGTGSPSARSELTPPPGSPSEAGSDTYGPVQKGDTLRKIAEETKPSSVSLEQMLVALYRENKSAFSGKNMNRLKTGQILKVPTAAEVEQVAAKDANKEIRTHVADWKTYREQVAGGVAAAPAPTRGESTNAASGRVGSAAVAPPPTPPSDNKDVLKLSRTDASGKAGAGKGAATDRLNAMQEELTAKDKALREANSRVSDLEKQIRDMQRLLDLTKAAPGKADTKVAVVPPSPTKAPEPVKTEPPKAEVKPADVKPADTKLAEAPKPFDPSKTVDTKAAAPTDPAKVAEAPKPAPPKADAPKVAPTKAAAKKAPPPKSFTDDLLDNSWIIAAGLGGLAAIGLIAFLFMRRRNRNDDMGAASNMTSAFPSDLKADSTAGKSGGGLVDTGNSSFLTDFDKTGPGAIDTDEVDPVAEAEVYIAYGRDAQAEEILKEAMARDRGRHEIALKLLEIYHARKSATAFETVAKELRSAVGDSHQLWLKAAAMGAQIDPTNPLYVSAAAGTATYTAMAPSAPVAQAKPNLDFDLDGSSGGAAPGAPAPDFDLDLDSRKPESHGSAPSSGMDFDIDSSHTPAPAPTPVHEEKPSFDFDLSGLDFPGSKSGGSDLDLDSKSNKGATMDMADLSLGGEGGEAVGTKLELAKAYLEIGDKDGAREILQEVTKEGSSAQRDEAQKLIASL